jgi:superfamily I DNA/RNA helicase
MTMHSLGLRAVRKAYQLLDGDQGINRYRVQEIIAELLGQDLRYLRSTQASLLRCTEHLVSLCKGNMIMGDQEVAARHGRVAALTALGPEELEPLLSHYEIDTEGVDLYRLYSLTGSVLASCLKVDVDRQIDYDDMVWLPVVLDLPVIRYDLLLVDEAQDLNRAQQALAKRCGYRLILCGDPRQAIYGFAGADADSMPRLVRELSAEKETCVVLPLTVTRRCGAAIVKEANAIVEDFTAHESNGPGQVRYVRYDDDGVTSWRSGVQDGDLILCRCNAPVISQCFRLIRQGLKANVLGRDIGKNLNTLVKKICGDLDSPVVELVRKLTDWAHHEQAKELAKRHPSESKVISIMDKKECILCFVQQNCVTVQDVLNRIDRVFVDNQEATGVRLSSIHKAKGLEARRVFFLRPEEAPCPHPMAKSPWQYEQERNLLYVGITRAIEELVYVL